MPKEDRHNISKYNYVERKSNDQVNQNQNSHKNIVKNQLSDQSSDACKLTTKRSHPVKNSKKCTKRKSFKLLRPKEKPPPPPTHKISNLNTEIETGS